MDKISIPKFACVIMACVCLFLTQLCVAQTAEIRLVAYNIPALLQTDGKGSYDKIIAQLGHISGRTWSYDVLNPQRAEKLFVSKEADCVFPLDKYFSPVNRVLQTDYLNLAKIHIFTPHGATAIDALPALVGLKVGARRGMPYGFKFEALQLDIEWVDDIDQNIRKIQAGRIDAFVAYIPDIWAAFKKNGMPQDFLSYRADKPLLVHEDAFLCHNNAASRAFVADFDAAIKTLRQSGKIQDMLGESYVAP